MKRFEQNFWLDSTLILARALVRAVAPERLKPWPE